MSRAGRASDDVEHGEPSAASIQRPAPPLTSAPYDQGLLSAADLSVATINAMVTILMTVCRDGHHPGDRLSGDADHEHPGMVPSLCDDAGVTILGTADRNSLHDRNCSKAPNK